MGLLRRKCQVAAKVESTKGTAETLTKDDADILAELIDWKISRDPVPRDPIRATLDRCPSMPGIATMQIDIRVEMKGSGTAGTAPSIGKLLCGCGFAEASAATVVYTPSSADASSSTLTMCVRIDGMDYKMFGARGNVKFSATANELMFAEFTFTGIFSAVTDTALFSGMTYESTMPAPFRATSTTLNFGTAWSTAVFSEFSLDMGNTVSLRSNANSATGLAYAQIVARDPSGTFDLDQVLVATQDLDAFWKTPTTAALAMDLGSAAGNKLSFAAPALQIVDMAPGERDGVATQVLTFHLRGGATGDDELTITHS